MRLLLRFRHFVIAFLTTSVLIQPAKALDTATITSSIASEDCVDYQVVGMCYWLMCTMFGCKVQTSVKVRHYIPDAVVSAYSNTGDNPWSEVSFMNVTHSQATGGGDATTNHEDENNLSRFKDADVIGHPGIAVFNAMADSYSCEGAGTPFMPYLIGTLDFLAWRQNIPEMVYPEALIPGMREVGNLANHWGNLYPRGGFLHQSDDYKTAAVIAQRAGDIVTRTWQPHVYLPLLADQKDGYWPAGDLIEGDASTGKWQDLAPTPSRTCQIFPHSSSETQATDGGYAFALWRPYSCCQRKGQIFLFSIDFNNPNQGSNSR
ncbi:hypothetical protein CUZ56_01351 [Saezia sanguinis]|uniref:TIGR03756 family integrating conjugative element protein n=1 Tax=Saezia sanguinis TaxID=1965230 RepID=A0A433SFD9_9BURK|nr:TIGR03756 family integrating conjugative element protein [Saezia sanguinis]RUS67406.1 hypothetical protein CUZ56_01351 [Saezia sanguinis]